MKKKVRWTFFRPRAWAFGRPGRGWEDYRRLARYGCGELSYAHCKIPSLEPVSGRAI